MTTETKPQTTPEMAAFLTESTIASYLYEAGLYQPRQVNGRLSIGDAEVSEITRRIMAELRRLGVFEAKP